MTQLAGFAHWEVRFDEEGRGAEPGQVDELLAGVVAEGIDDLFVLSHGWNNDAPIARRLYERFFASLRAVLDGLDPPPGSAIGTVGVHWPSMRWPDEDPVAAGTGGAAALGGGAVDDRALVEGLGAVFTGPEEQAALAELGRLLDERPDDPAALARFQELMGVLASGPDVADAPEDAGEQALLSATPEEVFGSFADEVDRTAGVDGTAAVHEGGAAGLGDVTARLWRGAKEALRQASYWRMKQRAGVVGQRGLGPLVGRLRAAAPDLRVHLVGHSFGARLVSYALSGLPAETLQPSSPVKSVLLLQGAFSHFAFADRLPHDPDRSGGLAGMAARVEGPLLVSHSRHDSAVGASTRWRRWPPGTTPPASRTGSSAGAPWAVPERRRWTRPAGRSARSAPATRPSPAPS